MKDENRVPLDRVRVIGIFAHVDAGKTTTSEAILYHTARIHRVGSVDEGNTQLDWMTQERERGITVTSAATTCEWRGHRINLIDTPGHIDFSAEVVRSIRVIDGAVIVLCGVGGVEPQTEAVWLHADREDLPRIIFVNKLDRVGSDFGRVLAEIRTQLTPDAVALQLPIGGEHGFAGIVELLSCQAVVWRGEAAEPTVEPIPASMAPQVRTAREALLDAICETDDELLELRLGGNEPDEQRLRAALRRATVRGRLVPVLCGSALKQIGIPSLLDAVAAALPAPADRPPIAGTDPATQQTLTRPSGDPSAPFCGVAFKIVTDPHVGHLTWVRAFSGRVATGQSVHNPRAGVEERVSRIYRMHANRREQVEEMQASDVVALAGVRSAVTGDTLCGADEPIELAGFDFPAPVIMLALTPTDDTDPARLHQAVRKFCSEDPTLLSEFDRETSELTLAGMGELHLEIVVDRLRTEFALAPEVSQPQIAYRETVRESAEATGTYRRQSGGHGHYAQVRLRLEPLPRGQGVSFYSAAPTARGGSGTTRGRHPVIPVDFVRDIELGIREALGKGVIAGYPFTGVRVTLLGGRFHEIDSSKADFRIAASMAVRQTVRDARPALLEPVMRVDVSLPDENLGAVAADLARRRGSVEAMRARGSVHRVSGEAPLAEVRGYATDLRGLTQGRATFTLEFRRYDIVPETIAAEIIAERREAGKIPER